MKPLLFEDDFVEGLYNLKLEDSGDWEYPFTISINDGLGEAQVSFSKAEAEAIKNWLIAATSPLENV